MPRRKLPHSPPKRVRDAMKAHGASVEKLVGEGTFCVENVKFGSAAWQIFEEWALEDDGDPMVIIQVMPGPAVYNTVLAPPEHMLVPIFREASSILHYYAQLHIGEFDRDGNRVAIGPPLCPPPPRSRVPRAKLALSALMQRIQDPPEDYPALRSLRPVSYICDVTQVWGNVTFSVELYKP